MEYSVTGDFPYQRALTRVELYQIQCMTAVQKIESRQRS